ncbi:SgcJ/EcaC family oxidoreductase [Thermobifida alba]|uniref:SgcJ/EcaC family oxidoreductase n=1 Tax=Thermobifida alba TaxID=53522 RepID=A0ABY4KZI4_THEAE|nr:SgcJ/EcaC family oxidoreductase [Thermobifida alba]UPT20846.1 SgcJ/EcaC family oxidoreductase [Thermobifida alba]
MTQRNDAAHVDEDARQTETEAIRQVVATVEHSQQNELPDEFVGLFRHDAIWTTAHGRRLTGRDEIAEFTRRVLPGAMGDLTATYEVEHVLFIRPDVAAVKVRQRYLAPDGQQAGKEGSPLYVMAKEDGRWRLVAGQNTQVVDS